VANEPKIGTTAARKYRICGVENGLIELIGLKDLQIKSRSK
jgi:hypothetical protein